MTGPTRRVIGSACGKVILLGEHAVVHGSSALASALELGVRIAACEADGPLTLSVPYREQQIIAGDSSMEGEALDRLACALEIDPKGASLIAEIEIPTRAGLGSSAALAAASARALSLLKGIDISDAGLFEAVQESERIFHGNPSGLDATVALGGGILVFSRSEGARSVEAKPLPLLIVNSGEKGDTKTTVAHFAERLEESEGEGKRRLSRIDGLVELGVAALEKWDLEALGQVMNENQEHLSWFGVSTPALNNISELAVKAGALGAKLTGGGGGGCAVVLTRPNDITVSTELKKAGYSPVAI